MQAEQCVVGETLCGRRVDAEVGGEALGAVPGGREHHLRSKGLR